MCNREAWMRTLTRRMALLSIVLVGPVCHDGSGGAVVVVDNGVLLVAVASDCPRCDDDADTSGYGRFTFTPDVTAATARGLQAVCGFSTSGGHDGTGGDSLQIASCGGGVELGFVSNRLSAYRLADGWQGAFAAGIRIGDDLETVLALEPGLEQVDPLTFLRDDGSVRIEANFDADLRLRELIVGRGFLR